MHNIKTPISVGNPVSQTQSTFFELPKLPNNITPQHAAQPNPYTAAGGEKLAGGTTGPEAATPATPSGIPGVESLTTKLKGVGGALGSTLGLTGGGLAPTTGSNVTATTPKATNVNPYQSAVRVPTASPTASPTAAPAQAPTQSAPPAAAAAAPSIYDLASKTVNGVANTLGSAGGAAAGNSAMNWFSSASPEQQQKLLSVAMKNPQMRKMLSGAVTRGVGDKLTNVAGNLTSNPLLSLGGLALLGGGGTATMAGLPLLGLLAMGKGGQLKEMLSGGLGSLQGYLGGPQSGAGQVGTGAQPPTQ